MPVKRVPRGGSTYSESVAVDGGGRWVFVSGQLAEGAAAGGSLFEQAHSCFNGIERALAYHGGTLADVLRITAYLTSLEDFSQFAGARGERFGSERPASTAVQVAGLLGGALLEVDAVALVEG